MLSASTLFSRTFSNLMILIDGAIVTVTVFVGLVQSYALCLQGLTYFGNNTETLFSSKQSTQQYSVSILASQSYRKRDANKMLGEVQNRKYSVYD
nr:hypothetical protein CFP56_47346 [Quercus suber]